MLPGAVQKRPGAACRPACYVGHDRQPPYRFGETSRGDSDDGATGNTSRRAVSPDGCRPGAPVPSRGSVYVDAVDDFATFLPIPAVPPTGGRRKRVQAPGSQPRAGAQRRAPGRCRGRAGRSAPSRNRSAGVPGRSGPEPATGGEAGRARASRQSWPRADRQQQRAAPAVRCAWAAAKARTANAKSPASPPWTHPLRPKRFLPSCEERVEISSSAGAMSVGAKAARCSVRVDRADVRVVDGVVTRSPEDGWSTSACVLARCREAVLRQVDISSQVYARQEVDVVQAVRGVVRASSSRTRASHLAWPTGFDGRRGGTSEAEMEGDRVDDRWSRRGWRGLAGTHEDSLNGGGTRQRLVVFEPPP